MYLLKCIRAVFGEKEDQPLDYDRTADLFRELTENINNESDKTFSPEEVAVGFINVGGVISLFFNFLFY